MSQPEKTVHNHSFPDVVAAFQQNSETLSGTDLDRARKSIYENGSLAPVEQRQDFQAFLVTLLDKRPDLAETAGKHAAFWDTDPEVELKSIKTIEAVERIAASTDNEAGMDRLYWVSQRCVNYRKNDEGLNKEVAKLFDQMVEQNPSRLVRLVQEDRIMKVNEMDDCIRTLIETMPQRSPELAASLHEKLKSSQSEDALNRRVGKKMAEFIAEHTVPAGLSGAPRRGPSLPPPHP